MALDLKSSILVFRIAGPLLGSVYLNCWKDWADTIHSSLSAVSCPLMISAGGKGLASSFLLPNAPPLWKVLVDSFDGGSRVLPIGRAQQKMFVLSSNGSGPAINICA